MDRRTAKQVYREFCNQLVLNKVAGIREPVGKDRPRWTLSELARHAEAYAITNKSEKTRKREQDVFKNLMAELG
ncbi:hypothetical protein KKA08_04245, partial [bacterium]|nr:hypothetical protein [bacterium]